MNCSTNSLILDVLFSLYRHFIMARAVDGGRLPLAKIPIASPYGY